MRNTIWNWLRSKLTEGMILPWWMLGVRAMLFPLNSFYWQMSKTQGYQWESDTWLIEGVIYSGTALRRLSKAQGETYRITRTGRVITLEQIYNTLGTRKKAAATLANDSFVDRAIASFHMELRERHDGGITNAASLLIRPLDFRLDESGEHPGERFVIAALTREEIREMLAELELDWAEVMKYSEVKQS